MTAAISDIERLAAKIAHDVLHDQTMSLSEQLGALKVLAPYYTILKKIAPQEDTGEETFSDFQAAMTGETGEGNGSISESDSAVRDHKRAR